MDIEAQEAYSKVKAQEEERKILRSKHGAIVQMTAQLILSDLGYQQLCFEMALGNDKLWNPYNPLVKPFLSFFKKHWNAGLLLRSSMDLLETRRIEQVLLETLKPRILKRQSYAMDNPVPLPAWEAAVMGNPLDRKFDYDFPAELSKMPSFIVSKSLLNERNS